ncbi:MAG TPA: hypothetical protein VN924_07110 [Bryobacteraceae bacterium]|nr:hypothetical protein [Bryobacteraceae bacterium]
MVSSTVGINPYIIGPPINDPLRFFGRTSLFDFIRSNLRSGAKVILLNGQRRIGKSSVLAQIPARVDLPDFVFASLDLQYVSNEPLSAILYKLALTIAAAVESAGSTVTPVGLEEVQQDRQSFRTVFLPRVFAALSGRNLVLLLDEFDVIDDQRAPAAAEPFFSYLRSAINEFKGLYLIAVVGRRADELGEMKALFHEAPSQRIGLLDHASAVELIRKPAESLLEFRPSGVDAILELTSGHPYFTQLMAYACYQRAEQRKRSVVEREDVDAVVDGAIQAGFPGLGWFHSGLPIRERVLFAATAECPERTGTACGPAQVVAVLQCVGVVVTPDLNEALGRIVEWGFVMQSGTAPRPALRITVELVRRWMVKYHPLRNEIKTLENASLQATAKYEAARAARTANDASAYALYREALALNPNHFAALSGAAELAFELRKFAEAADAYQRLYLADPTPLLGERLANAFVEGAKSDLASGNLDSARERARKALESDPENEAAQPLLNEIEAQGLRFLAARNPFSVGPLVPLDEFTGRRNQVGLALSVLSHRGHVLFFGERRMGKTSLLRYIASPMAWSTFGVDPDTIHPVYLDCSNIRPFSAVALWQEVAAALLNGGAEAGDVARAPGLLERLGRLIVKSLPYTEVTGWALREKGRRLVILLDEFDSALASGRAQSSALVADIRRLAIASPGGASLVLAMRRKPSDAADSTSPWYNIFEQVPVARLEPEEVSVLLGKMPYPLSQQETRWLAATTGRFPYVLSCGLSLLLQWRAAGKTFEALDASQDLFRKTGLFFSSAWAGATAVEKGILAAIAIRDCELRLPTRFSPSEAYAGAFSRQRDTLQGLQERGLIEGFPSTPAMPYTLGCSLWDLWIVQQLEFLAPRAAQELTGAFRELSGEQGASELRTAVEEIAARQVTQDMTPWTHPIAEG